MISFNLYRTIGRLLLTFLLKYYRYFEYKPNRDEHSFYRYLNCTICISFHICFLRAILWSKNMQNWQPGHSNEDMIGKSYKCSQSNLRIIIYKNTVVEEELGEVKLFSASSSDNRFTTEVTIGDRVQGYFDLGLETALKSRRIMGDKRLRDEKQPEATALKAKIKS